MAKRSVEVGPMKSDLNLDQRFTAKTE